MEIGKTLYVTNRKDWRLWLSKNYKKEKEIWLIYYKKSSGKPRISYNDAVEEALCYGWIDSIIKGIDEEKFAQRFTPRRPKSELSEMNRERVRRLVKQNKMTSFGIDSISHVFDKKQKNKKLIISPDILKALKQDKDVWNNFRKFPDSYKNIRISWIETARPRHEIFKTRLNYLIKRTKKNKKFGMIQ